MTKIKLKDNWFLERDKYQWILLEEIIPDKNHRMYKEGSKPQYNKTFHPTLKQVANKMLMVECNQNTEAVVESLEQLGELFIALTDELASKIEEVVEK